MRCLKGFSKEKIERLMDTDSNIVIVRGMGERGCKVPRPPVSPTEGATTPCQKPRSKLDAKSMRF